MRTAKRLFAIFVSLTMVLQLGMPSPEALAQGFDSEAGVAAYSEEANSQDGAPGMNDAAADSTNENAESLSGGSAANDANSTGPGADADASEDAKGGASSSAAEGDASANADSAAQNDAQQNAATEEDAVETQAATGYDINDADGLDKLITGLATVTWNSDKTSAAKISATDPVKTLVVLSHANPALYKDASIELSSSGNGCDLSEIQTIGSGTNARSWSFQGLGGEGEGEHFSGTLTSKNFIIATTLFNGLSIGANQRSYEVSWRAASGVTSPMLAKSLKSNGGSIEATVALRESDSNNIATESPLVGTIKGSLDLSVTYKKGSADGSPANMSISQDGNAGMLVNTVESGTLRIAGFDVASDFSKVDVKSAKGSANVGYLVGQVSSGAGLTIDTEVTSSSGSISGPTSGQSGNPGVGGVVGKAEGAIVTINAPVDVSELAVDGYSAGGFSGRAQNIKLSFGSDGSIAPSKTVGSDNATTAGGLFGEVIFANDIAFDNSTLKLDMTEGYTVKATSYVGGLFGILGFDENNVANSKSVSVDGLNVKTSQRMNKGVSAGAGSGGIVGSLSWNGCAGKLSVSNTKIDYSSEQGTHLGGVVGMFWGSGLLSLDNVVVAANLPTANGISSEFGGAVGSTYSNGLNIFAIVNDFSCSTSVQGNALSKGGGVFGNAGQKVVLELKGQTDLSGVRYESSSSVGQVVGAQNNALVFADGSGNADDSAWVFKRGVNKDGNGAAEIDDIGNYGEVVRLGDKLPASFIAVDAARGSLSINDGKKLSAGTNGYTLNSAADFALFALDWQTQHVFNLTGASSASDLASANITLGEDIDLSGTGITGFSRDSLSDGFSYSGALNGGIHTITLAIGEAYGVLAGAASNSNEGDGKVYRHTGLGLFARASGSANNVTVAGSVRFKAKSGTNDVAAGGYAAACAGDTTLSGVAFDQTIAYGKDDGAGNTFVGGAFGYFRNVDASGNAVSSILTFDSSTKIESTITADGRVNNKSYTGGAIGYIYDDSKPTVQVDDLTISASITASTGSDALPVGGFIGFIDQSQSANANIKTINIVKLSLAGLQLNLSSNKVVGGLLGYSWAQTEVSISSSSDAYAITTQGASLNANNAQGVGGLVYRAGGKWTIGEKAIDYSGFSISNVSSGSNSRLGLLVCRGGRGIETGANASNRTVSSLYLVSTAEWSDAYKVDGMAFDSVNANIFDEWVADTCETTTSDGTEDIFKSGTNGVVSLHTSGDAKNALQMDGKGRNTYVNRSLYGTGKQQNQRSRYYYNLDMIDVDLEDGACSNAVDSPEKLLFWSVYNYADSTIRNAYFSKGRCNSNTIKNGQATTFDLKGYSYYPIDLYDTNVGIENASFTFYNSQIEVSEQGNKLTSEGSQHWGMHCALFRNASINNTSINASCQISAKNVVFSGTIGKLGNNSGALLCGTLSGTITGSGANVYSISVNGCMLNGLRIRNYSSVAEYAPALINKTSSASSLSISGVTIAGYDGCIGQTVASSLVGDVGGSAASRVSVSFSNIALPSKEADKIFARATLLNSFAYRESGSGVYNFTSTETNVTYGSEIDNNGKSDSGRSVEYSGMQLWYYGAEQKDENLVTDGTGEASVKAGENSFKGYLPYVYLQFNASECQHELSVNHEVTDIVMGCGTYGHPYEITTAKQLKKVAEIINGTKQANNVKVRITTDQTELCSAATGGNGEGNHDVELTRNNEMWQSADGTVSVSDDFVQRYFQSAYYKISGNIELEDFEGLGNSPDSAFRGVIVGSSEGSITLSHNAGTMSGLVKYSYGSVVKDLRIVYKGSKLSVVAPTADRIKDNVPQAFFGGVIGCVLGGDNIIDGVSVTSDGFSVASEDKIIPVGGYIGVVSGGGVIFRNTSESSWHGASGSSAYDNPFLGRVLDGYAFSEDCAIDNGNVDSNYKINKIEPEAQQGVSTSLSRNYLNNGGTGGSAEYLADVQINSKQGLLILSAIINSGAASGPVDSLAVGDGAMQRGSISYLGGTDTSYGNYRFGNVLYGKVRNASYAHVGDPASAGNDFELAKNDDLKAPGLSNSTTALSEGFIDAVSGSDTNLPYLVAAYASNATAYICASSKGGNVAVYSTFKFAENSKIDVTEYGNGYLGLSARYVSNAALDMNGKKYAFAVNPHVLAIDGRGATISVYKNEKQYIADDYNALGAGGLFCTVDFGEPQKKPLTSRSSLISNLTINSSTIKFSYYDNGKVNEAVFSGNGNLRVDRLRSIMGVGGIAGVFAPNYPTKYTGGTISNFVADGISIDSPVSAGSIFGMAGYAGRDSSENNSYFANVGGDHAALKMVVQDSCYSNLDIQGNAFVGGFFGFLCSGASGSGVYSTNDAQLTVGSNSAIVARNERVNIGWGDDWSNASIAGGYAGQVKMSFNVCLQSGSVAFSNVKVRSESTTKYSGSGCVLGYLENAANSPTIRNVSVTSSGENKATCGSEGSPNSGGIIGRIGGTSSAKVSFASCTVKGIGLKAANYAGGLLGSVDEETGNSIDIDSATVDGVSFDSAWSGGLIGAASNSSVDVSIGNSTVANNIFNKAYAGALLGKAVAKQSWSNVLLNGNSYSLKDSQGLTIGDADDSCPGVYAAGINVRLAEGQTYDDLPSSVFRNDNAETAAAILDKSYVSYTNYENMSWDSENDKALYGEAAVDPYANMVPVSNAAIDGKHLFGDGMNVSLVTSIYDDNDNAVTSRFRYSNAKSGNDRQITPGNNVSSIAAQNDKLNPQFDVPVLLVSSGQDDIIEEYLDAVTNGGFSKARALGQVEAESTTYSFNYETGELSVPASDTGATGPTAASVAKSVVVSGSGTGLSFAVTSGYDNTLNRLTLIKVRFKTANDARSQTVYVPVVVRRMVQVDFTATMLNDTDFNKVDYASSDATHVLAAYGDTVTALLTYTYNSELGEYKDYDWNGHLEAGGSMVGVDKTLKFGSSVGTQGNYPAKTQLTLVDCADNNKMYSYEVPDGASIDRLDLSQFKDSKGTPYSSKWMSDIMGVKATEDQSGTWVGWAQNDDVDATASAEVDGSRKLFRVSDNTKDAGVPHYKLEVDASKQTPSEDFYLVIHFPSSDDVSGKAGLNGYLDTDITLGVPKKINHKLRAEDERNGWRDTQDNTASTYNILSGYSQKLTDNAAAGVTTLQQNTSDYSFGISPDYASDYRVNVSNKIQFAEGQIGNERDKLYYQLDASLALVKRSGTSETIGGATGFPVGTTGTVEFYVSDGNTFYTWNDEAWVSETDKKAAFFYPWIADGNEMKLTLGSSQGESNAVSLHGLRNEHASIFVTAVMDVHMTDAAHAAGIAASAKQGQDEYTKLLYRGVLATDTSRFANSSTVESIPGNHGFYRSGGGASDIELTADVPSQLGINVDDLSQADGTIAATGTYDLSNLNNSAEVIENATSIKYTLSLQKRTGTTTDAEGKKSGTYDSVDIEEYLSAQSAGFENALGATFSKEGQAFTWTDTKVNGSFATLSNGSRAFVLPFVVKVDTTKDAHTYANYRLVFTATLTSSGQSYTPENSDYITYTLTRVNLGGITGGVASNN